MAFAQTESPMWEETALAGVAPTGEMEVDPWGLASFATEGSDVDPSLANSSAADSWGDEYASEKAGWATAPAATDSATAPASATGSSLAMPQLDPAALAALLQITSETLLNSGLTLGMVKSYNGTKGFGFITSPSHDGDIFFNKQELPPEFQSEEGVFMQGRTVAFELTSDTSGRWRGSKLQLLPDEGKPVSGVIKSYSERNGYGFISSNALNRDAHFKGHELPPQAQSLALVGRTVLFHAHPLPDGKLRATNLTLKFNIPPVSVAGGQAQVGSTRMPSSDMLRGLVKSYDRAHCAGVLQAPGVAEEVYFTEDVGCSMASGQEVAFNLSWGSDGTAQATNVMLVDESQALTAAVTAAVAAGGSLVNGMQYTGKIKSYNVAKGYGFVNVIGYSGDIYFQTRDLSMEAQQVPLRGENLAGLSVSFQLEALPDGQRWHARSVSLIHGSAPKPVLGRSPLLTPSPAAMPALTMGTGVLGRLVDSMEVNGTCKSFNKEKSYGFITLPGYNVDVYFKLADLSMEGQLLAQSQGAGISGATMKLTLQELPGGRWRGRTISIVALETRPPAAAVVAAAAAPVQATDGPLFDGAELQGKVKSYNNLKLYGFINVPGSNADLYFQTKDLTPDTQQLLQEGGDISGAAVYFWLQALSDGRWHARDVGVLSEADAAQMANAGEDDSCAEPPTKMPRVGGGESGAAQQSQVPRVNGMIKSFNSAKGFGFITNPSIPGDIFFLRTELPEEMAANVNNNQAYADQLKDLNVSFELALGPDGKLRAKNLGFDL